MPRQGNGDLTTRPHAPHNKMVIPTNQNPQSRHATRTTPQKLSRQTASDRAKLILHAVDGGVGSRTKGIEKLKAAVAHLPKDADIVTYRGCCPIKKCPHVRPSFRVLKQLSFTYVRVLNIPTNMAANWYTKDYPTAAAIAPPAL